MRPATTRISVVLPQPLGPSRQTNSRLRTENETLCSATRPGLRGSFCSKKTLLSCLASSIANRDSCLSLVPAGARVAITSQLLSPQLLQRAVDKAAIEKLVERHGIFEEADLFQEIYGEVVGSFREVAVDAPDARIDGIIGLAQHFR